MAQHHLLGAEKISLTFPTKDVFTDLTLGIAEGDRTGIVGRNGDGKSSLLKILTSQIQPTAGQVTRRGGVSIGMLSQQDTINYEQSVAQNIVGDVPEHEWATNPQIRDVINGLVADLDWLGSVSKLSGGQKRRVALAAILVQDWDILALDEPTNHLDIEGIAWLAAHLKTRWSKNQGALLVITHDRWFLDEVCNLTWEMHNGTVEQFEGGYAAYVLQRIERDRILQSAAQKRNNLLRKELAWLRRGAPARTSKPKFRIDAANELIADVPPLRDSINLQRLSVSRLGREVVKLCDVTVRFSDATGCEKTVLDGVDWDLSPGERTGILGANGAGKSTLISVIAGTLEPTSGRVKRGKTVKLAVLDQSFSQLQEIGADRVREVLARTKTSFNVGGKELTPAQLLERLGFSTEQLSTPVADLSGGQKRRLQLLLILLSEPNVLILDEPTNDVDSEMLTAMEDLLDSWPGTLLVISHDRYLLERVTDNQYTLLQGKLRHLPRGVAEYLELRRIASAAKQQQPTRSANTSKTATELKSSELKGNERRSLEKELAAVTRKIDKIAAQISAAEAELAQLDQTDYELLNTHSTQIAALRAKLEQLEDRWLELGELLQ
ncbi:ATP-binding cassette domain-containing protein [Canibacter sp. lx-45]|uniref:ABC-F family ATP-binding cassette domain-containing protein n=1 Tax=Canibacter zhuwentaonis TaxID=2837491 RepID=UPI001BDC5420|nr:ABC-F family ATP-binding cassette domain-containing protein [Canibacter zhuwentaonis]MBT1035131.1 ATP-binding cassette domain-containing protein [Canibacter zhuwentaonis]